MLFLRLDQALDLLSAARNMKQKLVIRYLAFNGLSPMEISRARIEHLDPVEQLLFLPRRHWKRNCLADIDPETVRLQIIYTGSRKKGPLIRSHRGGHLTRWGIYDIVKRVAKRTAIPNAEKITPRILKRTFAREWRRPTRVIPVKCPGCGREFLWKCDLSAGGLETLQKAFSHKHLSSTAHYLRFDQDDVRRDHAKLMRRVKRAQETERPRLVP